MVAQRCQRCHGNLFLELDQKWQTHCLQCGEIRELDAKVTPEQRRKFSIEVATIASPMDVSYKPAKQYSGAGKEDF